jgi:hypothetical protein
MSTIELRKRLIEKIKTTDSDDLLKEAYRLLELGAEDTDILKLSSEQMVAIREAQNQIKNGLSLTDEEADKEINEWLKK